MTRAGHRRWFVPEVVQTSAMDCGPAALAALTAGFGLPVDYGALREACHTGVDGTSIDTMEDLANLLGLDAEQVMMPLDRILARDAGALPAIVISRMPNGFLHFVVAWRTHGPLVQVMDPAVGRRFRSRARFLADCYVHTAVIPAASWREMASDDSSLRELRTQLAGLGAADADALVDRAAADPGWRGLAQLEATVRMVTRTVADGDLKPGPATARLVEALTADPTLIPASWWPVTAGDPALDGEEQVALRGVVLVRAMRASAAGDTAATSEPPPELRRKRSGDEAGPLRWLSRLLPARVIHQLLLIAVGSVLMAAGVVAEAGLIAAAFGRLAEGSTSGGVVIALLALAAALMVISYVLTNASLGLGRQLEHTLRLRLTETLPRLSDGYFRSRPVSDMAERAHSLHRVRLLPDLGIQALRSAAELMFTAIGLVWLDPASAVPALLGAAAACAVPLAFQPILAERDLRLRTHQGALGQTALDALLGLVPIRVQRAAPAISHAHQDLLREWQRSGRAFLRAAVTAETAQALVTAVIVAWLLFGFVPGHGDPAATLLFVYWTLLLPVAGYDLALGLRRWPPLRTVLVRLSEPLAAPERVADDGAAAGLRHVQPSDPPSGTTGTAIDISGVTVHAGGQPVLQDVSLTVSPGEHVAIVGPSGAGKSTMLGLLLGWHTPSEGEVLLDGRPLRGDALARLREVTAWVDPSIQLWNRALADNLAYGAPNNATPLAEIVDLAGLHPVASSLPDGLATPLGEGGALVSGGEGQRVRLGRALSRRHVRLVLLDEPFRGLDRATRAELLAAVRARWPAATLLCATHDVSETRTFDRVLVIDGGRLIEDGPPELLAADNTSSYRAMLDAETQAHALLFTAAGWRHVHLDGGRLSEGIPPC